MEMLIAERICREFLLKILKEQGILEPKSEDKEGIIWLKIGRKKYVRVQLSSNKDYILGLRGIEDIHIGIVPMWVDRRELEIAFVQGDGKKIVKKIVFLTRKIIKNFHLKTFESSNQGKF